MREIKSSYHLKQEVLDLLEKGLDLPEESKSSKRERGRPKTEADNKEDNYEKALRELEEYKKKVKGKRSITQAERKEIMRLSNLASARKSRHKVHKKDDTKIPVLRRLR